MSASTPIQHALPALLAAGKLTEAAISGRTTTNLALLDARLASGSAAGRLHVEGGWYATLRIPAVKSEEEWVLEFLNEDHVSVYPGYFFDFEREAYIVLSLLPPARRSD